MRFRETIGHTGRMRVAFDPEGADLADFNAHILADIPDPAGNTGNSGAGNLWQVDVILPHTPCTNCSLQLMQVMNNDDINDVPDPTGFQTYFQCAAITISGDPSAGGASAAETDDDDPSVNDGQQPRPGSEMPASFGCASGNPSSVVGIFAGLWLLFSLPRRVRG